MCFLPVLLAAGALWQRGPEREGLPEDNSASDLWKVPGTAGLHPETDQQHFLTVSLVSHHVSCGGGSFFFPFLYLENLIAIEIWKETLPAKLHQVHSSLLKTGETGSDSYHKKTRLSDAGMRKERNKSLEVLFESRCFNLRWTAVFSRTNASLLALTKFRSQHLTFEMKC